MLKFIKETPILLGFFAWAVVLPFGFLGVINPYFLGVAFGLVGVFWFIASCKAGPRFGVSQWGAVFVCSIVLGFSVSTAAFIYDGKFSARYDFYNLILFAVGGVLLRAYLVGGHWQNVPEQITDSAKALWGCLHRRLWVLALGMLWVFTSVFLLVSILLKVPKEKVTFSFLEGYMSLVYALFVGAFALWFGFQWARKHRAKWLTWVWVILTLMVCNPLPILVGIVKIGKLLGAKNLAALASARVEVLLDYKVLEVLAVLGGWVLLVMVPKLPKYAVGAVFVGMAVAISSTGMHLVQNIDQYGLTPNRMDGAALVAFFAVVCFVLGFALLRGYEALRNVLITSVMAGLFALCLGMMFMQVNAISAKAQYTRFARGEVAPTAIDYAALQHKMWRHGRRVISKIAYETSTHEDVENIRVRIAKAQDAKIYKNAFVPQAISFEAGFEVVPPDAQVSDELKAALSGRAGKSFVLYNQISKMGCVSLARQYLVNPDKTQRCMLVMDERIEPYPKILRVKGHLIPPNSVQGEWPVFHQVYGHEGGYGYTSRHWPKDKQPEGVDLYHYIREGL